jgi:hypothetical protein
MSGEERVIDNTSTHSSPLLSGAAVGDKIPDAPWHLTGLGVGTAAHFVSHNASSAHWRWYITTIRRFGPYNELAMAGSHAARPFCRADAGDFAGFHDRWAAHLGLSPKPWPIYMATHGRAHHVYSRQKTSGAPALWGREFRCDCVHRVLSS